MDKDKTLKQFRKDLDIFLTNTFFIDYLIDEEGGYVFEFGPFEVGITPTHQDGPLEFVTAIYGLYQDILDKSFSMVLEKLKKEQGERVLN